MSSSPPSSPNLSLTPAQMEMQIEESLQRTRAHGDAIRPSNTLKAYTKRQQEFLKWCDSKQDGWVPGTAHTVTAAKLHLFLEEQVIGRISRKGKQPADGTIGPQKIISKATVNAYVAAIVDLWRSQCKRRINSNPHPVDHDVKQLLKNVGYGENKTKKDNYVDRGIGTLLDGYTSVDQLRKITNYFWSRTSDFGPALRNLTAFLLSNFAILRGENARAMELPDMHSISLSNEGPSDCHALVLVLRQGKTNQFNRYVYRFLNALFFFSSRSFSFLNFLLFSPLFSFFFCPSFSLIIFFFLFYPLFSLSIFIFFSFLFLFNDGSCIPFFSISLYYLFRLEISACLRNKEVAVCPIGGLAFYLFWRWHMENEEFPSFQRSQDWYDIKLLKSGKNLKKEMDYKVRIFLQ